MKQEDIKQMNEYFELIHVTDLTKIKKGDAIPESDYSLMVGEDKFLQFKFTEKEPVSALASPGLFEVAKVPGVGLQLEKVQFLQDRVLPEYTSTANITNKIDQFFKNIDKYKNHGIFPKRAMLFYGPPGTGKTQSINIVSKKYLATNDTLVLIWRTDRCDADDMSSFLKKVKYTPEIQRMILIAEDIGGGEIDVQHQRAVDSSLLALLDNSEQVYKVPTMILATTNYPQNLLSNLTDRPQRFDDLIEVGFPGGVERAKLLEFFAGTLTEEEKEEIAKPDYDTMSVAHLKEIMIRSDIYDISKIDAMRQLREQSEKVKRDFSEKKSMGLGMGFGDD